MKAKFKEYINRKKNKDLKIESLSHFTKEELQDLVLRMEQELRDSQERMQSQIQDCKKQKDETEGFQMTIEQLQEALQSTVKQLQEEINFNEEKDKIIQELNQKNQGTVIGFEKKKDLFEKLKVENINYMREIEELKIQLQLRQYGNQEYSKQQNQLEKQLRENLQIKSDLSYQIQQKQDLQQMVQQLTEQTQNSEKDKLSLQEKNKNLSQLNTKLEQDIKNQKSQIVQIQESNKNLTQKIESLKQDISYLNQENEQKKNESLSILKSLQESNQINQDLQLKIKEIEFAEELKQTKFNHEILHLKESYERLIKDLKEEQNKIQENDMRDSERLHQLVEELDKIRNSNKQKCEEIQDLQKRCQQQETDLLELKLRLSNLEADKIKLQQKVDLAEKKRELAKKEVLKLSEKLEKRGVAVGEDQEGDNYKNNRSSNGIIQHSLDNISTTSQFCTLSNMVTGKQISAFLNFKKEFELLYKDLMRMVMTAPSSLSTQIENKEQSLSNQESFIDQDQEVEQKPAKKNQSFTATKIQVKAINPKKNIVFTIPAQEFSKYERKYNNTLVNISDWIESISQDPKIKEEIQREHKWYTIQNLKGKVHNMKQNITQNHFQMLRCMQVDGETGTIIRQVRNQGRPPMNIRKQNIKFSESKTLNNSFRQNEESNEIKFETKDLKRKNSLNRPIEGSYYQNRVSIISKNEKN